MLVPLGDSYYFKFSTRSFSTGAPTTLSGTPVISVYEENNLTQITAGITLTADYDSVTGLNDVAIVATSGNGYEVGKYYDAVITTGTVGGVSVVGETVGHFRVGPAEDAGAGIPDVNITHFGDSAGTFSAGRPEVNATHFAGTAYATALAAEIDAVWDEAAAGHLTAGTIGLYLALAGGILVDTTVTGTPTSTTLQLTAGSTIDDFYNDQLLYIITGTGTGQVRVITDYVGATKTITIDEAWVTTPVATDRIILLSSHVHPVSQIADAVWDEVLTAATHNVATSAGRRLRQIEAAFVVAAGTAQAGGANTITLAAGESATDNIFNGDRVAIIGGTGVGEHGIITDYNGTTKVATMSQNWVTTPDATSEYELIPADVDVETWQHNVVTASASGLPDVNVNEVGDTAQTAGDLAALITTVDTVVDAILAMLDDPRAEPGQGAPAVNADLATKIDYLYKAWRNKKDNDGTTTNLYADDGTTVDQKQSTSEAGGTVTKAEWITGP